MNSASKGKSLSISFSKVAATEEITGCNRGVQSSKKPAAKAGNRSWLLKMDF